MSSTEEIDMTLHLTAREYRGSRRMTEQRRMLCRKTSNRRTFSTRLVSAVILLALCLCVLSVAEEIPEPEDVPGTVIPTGSPTEGLGEFFGEPTTPTGSPTGGLGDFFETKIPAVTPSPSASAIEYTGEPLNDGTKAPTVSPGSATSSPTTGLGGFFGEPTTNNGNEAPTGESTPTQASPQPPTSTSSPTTELGGFFGEPTINKEPPVGPGPTASARPSIGGSMSFRPTAPKQAPISSSTSAPSEPPIDFVDGVDTLMPSVAPTATPRPTRTRAPTTSPTSSAGPTKTTEPSSTDGEDETYVDYDDDEECYSTWSDLVDAISLLTSSGESMNVQICSNTTLALTPLDDPVVFAANDTNTTIGCGPDGALENRCAIFGGSEQFRIAGSNTSISMRGLSMIASTVAAVNAKGDDTSYVAFHDCEFSGHLGLAAVLNYHTVDEITNTTTGAADRGGGRKLLVDSLTPPMNRSMTVELDSCVFSDNQVLYAPFANLGGDATVTGTVFSGNTGESGAIGSWFGAVVNVSTSCFIGNTGNESNSILVDIDSEVGEQIDNYAEVAVNDTTCRDLLLPTGVCESFTADACLAPRVVDALNETDNNTTDCVDDWEVIHQVATNSSSTLVSPVVTICPGTAFNMSAHEENGLAPLVITSSSITLQCGDNGLNANECFLFGGTRHIEIKTNASYVTISGFTFQNASDTSVVTTTSSGLLSVIFHDCVWKKNSGASAFSIERDGTGHNVPEATPSSAVSSAPSMEETGDGGNDDVFQDDFFTRDLQDEPVDPLPSSVTVHLRESSFLSNSVAEGVLVIEGADFVIIESCQFTDNVAGGSIVAHSTGVLNMTRSCFHGNQFTAVEGVIYSTSPSGFVLMESFAENNIAVSVSTEPDCEGVRASDGSCTLFDAMSCPLLPVMDCFASWKELGVAISSASSDQMGRVFNVCEDTTLAVDSLSAPISIDMSDTVLQCGQFGVGLGNCTIMGGEVQFRITGTPTGVEFRGLTFSNSSGAAVLTAGGRSARAAFYDCRFENHVGFAALLNYHGSLPSPGAIVDDIQPPDDRSMQIEIDYCTFTGNVVSYAPVTNLGGSVLVSNSIFEDNAAQSGGVGVWLGGGMTLVQSCFEGNTGSLSGSVYVGLNSTLALEEENHGTNNTVPTDGCTDVVKADGCESDGVCNGLCIGFSEQECAAEEPPTSAPSLAPSFQPTSITSEDGCFTDWSRLASAVRATNFSLGLENVFTICPNTTLDVSIYPDEAPITLSAGDVLIQCGADGKAENNCTVSGGTSHFRIKDSPKRTIFSGLSMEGSTVVSIQAFGQTASRVRFKNCQWKNNVGVAVVLIYNEEAGEPYTNQTEIDKLDEPSSESMTAEFEFCHFENNNVMFATIATVSGTLTVSETIFIDNMGARVGVISASGEALVSVYSSCFVENQSEFPGTIFIAEGSEAAPNTGNNYGFDNQVGFPDGCKGIFQETSGSCFEEFTCGGTCSEFEERSCDIPGFDADVPTFTPTQSPSFGSAGGPSASPPSSLGDVDVKKQSFAGTTQFLITLVLALVVVFGGIGAFFYFRKRGKSKAAHVHPAVQQDIAQPLVDNGDNGSAFMSQQESRHEEESAFRDEPVDDEESDPFADEDE